MKQISDQEYETICQIIYKVTGISLADNKKSLVVSRLWTRLNDLGLQTFSQYIHFLSKNDQSGKEITEFINRITTNLTSFFREEKHFEILRKELLPALVEQKLKEGQYDIRVWCSAASTGEEPYTIAIVIAEYLKSINSGLKVKVFATDINTEVLSKADHGVYLTKDVLTKIPQSLADLYFNKINSKQSQVIKNLRDMIVYRKINLISDRYPLKDKVDIVFCRNVLIYFDSKTKDLVTRRLAKSIVENGYLFIGHSENLFEQKDCFKLRGNTIYTKVDSI